jgi:hypothetical protein
MFTGVSYNGGLPGAGCVSESDLDVSPENDGRAKLE